MSSVDAIREFVLQIEKTLAAHRLYHPSNAAYHEANERLLEKCRAAASDHGFTLIFGESDLFVDKISVLNRPKHDDSFFFPLFRDGLRELTFAPDVSAADINALLDIITMKDHHLPPADDLVNQLWRLNLTTIHSKSTDGIGDSEDDGSEGSELQAQITELASQIQSTAPPVRPRDTPAVETHPEPPDVHEAALNLRRAFEADPSIFALDARQAEEIRKQLSEGREHSLVERFIEILLVIVRSPMKSIEPAAITPVFQQLADRYWSERDYARVVAILRHVHAAAAEVPNPGYRAALADVIRRFLTTERLNLLMLDFVGGALPVQLAVHIWDLVPDEVIWPILLDVWSRLPDGETRTIVLNALRRRIASNMNLLRNALKSPDAGNVRAALLLLDDKIERLFADELIRLADHSEETLRLKGLAAAARLGGSAAREALWKAVQGDPSKSVRLYAFRAMSTVPWPELPARLEALVTDPQFAERPLWEREKYVRLLGEIGGPAMAPLFQSWIPSKRWMWSQTDLEVLSLALRGLGATGQDGMQIVQQFVDGGGKPAEVARKIVDSLSRTEIGDTTTSRRLPTLSNVRLPDKS